MVEIILFLHSTFLNNKNIPNVAIATFIVLKCQVNSIYLQVSAFGLLKKYPAIVTPEPIIYKINPNIYKLYSFKCNLIKAPKTA